MSPIRLQKIKLRQLVEESDLARVESVIRTEPLVVRARSAIGTASLVKSLGGRVTRAFASNPKRPYAAIAGTFAVSFLLPLLFGRSDRK